MLRREYINSLALAATSFPAERGVMLKNILYKMSRESERAHTLFLFLVIFPIADFNFIAGVKVHFYEDNGCFMVGK